MLAEKLHLPLQECQQKTTSTEFLKWMQHFRQQDVEEWHYVSKQDQYLAQIAAEIRQIRVALTEKEPRLVDVEECVLKFQKSGETPPVQQVTQKTNKHIPEVEREEVEVGPDLVKDPKWAVVNARAKALWASRLGVVDDATISNSSP